MVAGRCKNEERALNNKVLEGKQKTPGKQVSKPGTHGAERQEKRAQPAVTGSLQMRVKEEPLPAGTVGQSLHSYQGLDTSVLPESPETGCWQPGQTGLGRVCCQGLPRAYLQPLREKGRTVSYYLEGGDKEKQGKASSAPFLHLHQMKKPLLYTVSISTSSAHPTRAEQEMVFPMSQKLEIP